MPIWMTSGFVLVQSVQAPIWRSFDRGFDPHQRGALAVWSETSVSNSLSSLNAAGGPLSFACAGVGVGVGWIVVGVSLVGVGVGGVVGSGVGVDVGAGERERRRKRM